MSATKSNVTPMMAQFLGIKEDHPDALLFYRMGDFYELFFDDAIAASAALDIALTKRGKHLGEDIAMCGVPVHAAEGYLQTLIRSGFRVAVCEQLESPAEAKKRGGKSVVKRGVVRLVTPGTLTEDTLLNARRHNYLAAFAQVRDAGALAWVDISTGEVRVTPCPQVKLGPQLARLAPSEVLVSEAIFDTVCAQIEENGAAATPLSRASFDSDSGSKRVCALYSVSSLDAFGAFSRAEVAALGALVDYLEITQRGKLPLLQPPVREIGADVMEIDAATRRNLELTQALSGGRAGSLLYVIDRTLTAAGARLLERRLSSPSLQLETIAQRHDAVDSLTANTQLREDLRARLRQVPDIDRALSRIALERGGPRDLAAIRNALEQSEQIANLLTGAADLLAAAQTSLTGHASLHDLLDAALVAEPPMLARDGGFIAPDYDDPLDQARQLRDEGRGVIAGLQQGYAEIAGIPTLKIKHNNVLGYFIETTATHATKMLAEPLSETFIHRQTTANAVRFTTLELSELETKILNAGGEALTIENRLYSALTEAVLESATALSTAARALAEIDLAAGLADLAMSENWSRPSLDHSRKFAVDGGRHPVVEAALRQGGTGSFVPNDCHLSGTSDEALIWLLTGPNMAGKSTFLRQNALIALLAQMGSFVPATRAEIGIVSQLFSRVGASDDLARGRSTFMVEMVETAAILNQADDRALVILDEIGRGTSTYDGLSIAWATLEHLTEDNGCRALFATHYHELTQLSDRLTRVENATVAVREWEGEVIFLHEVRRGAADRSYGVQVAKLAGLPPKVIERARVVLDALERGEREGEADKTALIDDLPLFSATPAPAPVTAEPSKVEAALKDIHPDELSPREALALIYSLKSL